MLPFAVMQRVARVRQRQLGYLFRLAAISVYALLQEKLNGNTTNGISHFILRTYSIDAAYRVF